MARSFISNSVSNQDGAKISKSLTKRLGFVNVDMCKTVLIAGVSTDSAAIFIELSKCFCEVLLFLGCIRVCLVTGTQLAGRRGDVSPTHF